MRTTMVTIRRSTVALMLVVGSAAVAEEVVELPEGYQKLAYIESTGTQYIDTGLKASANTTIDVSFGHISKVENVTIFGTSRWNTQACLFIIQSNVFKLYGASMITLGDTTTITPTDDYRLTWDSDNVANLYVNGEVTPSHTGTSERTVFGGSLPLWIFKGNSGSSKYATMRLYAMKIGEGTTPMRDFVPAYRESDSEIGLWDRVTQKFFGHGGAATFMGRFVAIEGADYAKTSTRRVIADGVNLSGSLVLEAGSLEVAEASSQEIRCGALTLAGGTIPFATLGQGTPEIKVAGTATVAGLVTVKVPAALAEGTYNLVTASSFTVSDGGAVTLATGCETGSDGATRRLEVTATGLQLVVGARALPAGYVQLPSIMSSGTQWINTGYELRDLCSLDFRFSSNTYIDQTVFFGQDSWNSGRYLLNQQGGKLYFHGYGIEGHGDILGAAPAADVSCHLIVGADNMAKLQRGDAEIETYPLTKMYSGADRTLYLFAGKNGIKPAAYSMNALRIADQGEIVRDFVPCRNPSGEAGLWDFVEGKFYGNEGAGAFATPTETGARLNYVASDGRQRVKLDYEMDEYTTMDFRFGHPVFVKNVALFGLAWNNSCYLLSMQENNMFCFWGNGAGFTSIGLPDASARYHFTVNDSDVARLEKQNTDYVMSMNVSRSVAQGGTDKTLSIFACNTSGHASAYRFYSMEIGKGEGNPRIVTAKLRLVPYREASGRVGLLDELSGTFYPNVGTAGLGYGYAFNAFEGGVTIYDGRVEVEDALDGQNVVKAGDRSLDLASVGELASLNLAQGEISFVDQTARTVNVTGALTMTGGTRLVFDVVPGGCDDIVAGNVGLSSASAENPVVIRLVQKGSGTFSETGKLTLLAGGLVAGDEAKFQVEGLPATLSVENGRLIATLPPDIPYTAIWTGKGDRTNMSDPANWNCLNYMGQPLDDVSPTEASAIVVGANTTFSWPAGQTLKRREMFFENPVTLTADCDWRGFEVPIDFTVRLNGHKLYLSDLVGSGRIEGGTAAYQELEYIESTGTQSIDTKLNASGNTTVDICFGHISKTENATVFGTSRWDSQAYLFIIQGGAFTLYGASVIKLGDTTTISPADDYRLTWGSDNMAKLYVNGEETPSYTGTSGRTVYGGSLPLWIFKDDDGRGRSKYATMRLHGMKIWESGALQRDFVPARRVSDGAIGLIDRANGDTWYGNNGTGVFLAGPTVLDGVALDEVHIDIPEGRTVTNPSLLLTGALKLVLEGNGVYRPARVNQGYIGGTVVVGGVAHAVGAGTDCRYGVSGSEIAIGEGAAMEMDGKGGFQSYRFVLDGGTLKNSTALVNAATTPTIAQMRVTADSEVHFNQYGFVGTAGVPVSLDLGGNKLDVFCTDGGCIGSATATRGMLELHGPVVFTAGSAFSGVETTLVVEGPLALDGATLDVGTYVARSTTTQASGNGEVLVNTRFVPETDNFWGCVLKNGATLDLSTRTAELSTTGALVGTDKNRIAFEENGRIFVDVGTRRIADGEILATWSEKPSARFLFANRPNFMLEARNAELVCVSNGTFIFVR